MPLLPYQRTLYEVKEVKEMPDLLIRLGQYCIICQYKYEDKYLVCDYCNEHKTWIYLKDRYYNYLQTRLSYMH